MQKVTVVNTEPRFHHLENVLRPGHAQTVQAAQLRLTDRATAYVQKVHCTVVSPASGSVQGETQRGSPGKNNATKASSAECI